MRVRFVLVITGACATIALQGTARAADAEPPDASSPATQPTADKPEAPAGILPIPDYSGGLWVRRFADYSTITGFADFFDNDFTEIGGRFVFQPGEGLTLPTTDQTWSAYWSGWQYLYVEDPSDAPIDLANGTVDHQGIGLFARFGFADQDVNPVDWSLSGGVGGKGIIPTRDNDTFGVGYYYTQIQTARLGGIFYIWGDNGSSAEGQNGSISEPLAQNGIPTTVPQHIKALDELGGLDALGTANVENIYHAGWGWAGSAPYKSTKLVASHFGGIRQPMAVSWPKGIKPDATPRSQFRHVIDIVPTIYEVTKIRPPRVVNGIEQMSIDGVSMAYTFADAKAKDRRTTQLFDVMGSRGLYKDGRFAGTFGPRTPWLAGMPKGITEWSPENDKWELYNLSEDWTQADDLAEKMPGKVAEMKALFLIESAKNGNLPIGGGLWAMLHPEVREGAGDGAASGEVS